MSGYPEWPEMFPASARSAAAFAISFGVVAIVVLAVAKLVSTLLVSSLDRTAASVARSAPRGRVAAQRGDLAPGVFPRADDVPAIAYLRGGLDAVATTLLAEGSASGWLTWVGGRGVAGKLRDDGGRRMRELHSALDRARTFDRERALEIARHVASGLVPTIEAELARAGMWRSSAVRGLGALPTVVAGALLIGVGALRVSHGFDSPGQALAVIGSIAGAAGAAIALSRVAPESERAHAYLDWLRDVTSSLCAAVESGRSRRIADVALATALGARAAADRGTVVRDLVEATGGASASGGGCGG
jgi:hypothetical protein